MIKRKFIILMIFVAFIITGCSSKTTNTTTTNTNGTTGRQSLVQSSKTYYDYFSTVITIQVWNYQPLTDSQWTDIENILKDVQHTFSRSEQDSELYKLNQSAGSGTPFKCSTELYNIIKLSYSYATLTNGKFDPAIGPLEDLWGFGITSDPENNNESRQAPTQAEINALLPLVNYKLIKFDDENQTVYLPDKGMVIDLGAIAKGYATDKIANYLRSQGIDNAILNLGGNIYTLGIRYKANSDGSYFWTIGIRDPKGDPTDSILSLQLYNKTVVTSGTYEQYFKDPVTHITYHHILDPDTGYPVGTAPDEIHTIEPDQQIASVSIITDNSTNADALSTSIFCLGLKDGMDLVEKMPGIEAIFITADNKIHASSGVQRLYNMHIFDK